tara:strand:- start:4745 stop:5569 length:825 start_codon:yes stop_codon:yes gene_type:complete
MNASTSTVSITSDMKPSLLDSNACFDVQRLPVYYQSTEGMFEIENRDAVVRTDNGQWLSFISDEYSLVPHKDSLSVIENAMNALGVKFEGAAYTYRGGAKFRAIYVVDESCEVLHGDHMKPVIQVAGSYDATSRERILLGGFRTVCLNLNVSGGSNWGGFSAVHRGNLEEAVSNSKEHIESMIESFPEKIKTFSRWSETEFSESDHTDVYENLTKTPGMKKHAAIIAEGWSPDSSVWDAYNVATEYATHQTRSAVTAWKVSEKINKQFFGRFNN